MADSLVGKAVLTVNLSSNNVQISNFGSNSFQITNTGQKTIAQVEIDVTNALYPDSVFDPFGLAGDTASKPLQIDTNGNTGVVAPSNASYIGVGGRDGFEGIRLVFNPSVNGGFQPGETLGFSVDMDPNSVAGTNKSQLDGGSSPSWDVGGVSGAELIGSTFTVTFTDGTTATGQLQGAGNQGGSKGIAAQDSPNLAVTLSVNGLNPGSIGTYGSSGPSVIINGPAGKTARVVLTKGFIQPVNPYAAFLQTQLDTLAAANFPANNAVEFQTVNIQLTGANQNISNLFNFSNVAAYNFVGEDKLPLGFVASVIDPSNSDLPLGPVTQPIYLKFSSQSAPPNQVSILSTQPAAEPSANGLFTVSLSAPSAVNTVISYSVSGTATASSDYAALSGTVTIPAGQLSATIPVSVLDDALVEGSETVIVTLTGVTGAADVVLGAAKTATVAIADDDLPLSTLTVQAESIANITGYRLESNGLASGGALLSLVGGATNEVGTATFNFTGATGTYNVILGTFDENDGAATFQLTKNDTTIGSVVLDQNLGGNAISAATKVEKVFATGVAIANGDTLKITGLENAGEHARFDFIRFEPVSSTSPLALLEAPQNSTALNKLVAEPIHSLELIASDMALPHEGKLKGVPDYYSWAVNPEIVLGNNPGNFQALIAWGQIYEDAAGSSAQNTRIQIRNIQTYVLSKKTGTWNLVQNSVDVEGAAFREDYADNVNAPADIRDEPDGSISVKLTPGYNYHFWPTGGRVKINPGDIAGVFTTVEARLIVDDPTRPDDRDKARFLAGMGGDYWLNTTADWDYFKTNGAIASGRLRYVDSQWNSFNMTTLTRSELFASPPPIPLATAYSISGLESGALTGKDPGAIGDDAALFSNTNFELADHQDFGSDAFYETNGLITTAKPITPVETGIKTNLDLLIGEGDRNPSIITTPYLENLIIGFESHVISGDLSIANQY